MTRKSTVKKQEPTKKNKIIEAEVVGSEIQTITPMTLIQKAQSQDASIEKMEQLFKLQLRWEENESKKAFHKAVAAFKSESIDIIKGKKVSFTTSKGKTEYNHAELGQVVNIVTPLLSKHGLSHHWEYDQPDNQVKVTCVLTHEGGYSKSTSLQAGKDDSGGKNTIQAIGSATSYLERYTFLALCGLASREQDDDGRGSEVEIDYITDSQVMDLEALASEVKAPVDQFLGYLTIQKNRKISDLAEIAANEYDYAVAVLEKRRTVQ